MPAALIVVLCIGAAVFCGKRFSAGVKQRLYPIDHADELIAAADRYGLDRALVAAVVKTESGFKANAVSSVGARGLMQLMPATAEWIASKRGLDYDEERLFDVETNLDYGCWLLKYLIDRYGGSVRNALIAYNAGSGRLDEWLKTGADDNGELIEIPYPETRSYVQKITELTEKYRDLYEDTLSKN